MVTGLPYLERVARIELANKPWQGFRLPLHHTRIKTIVLHTLVYSNRLGGPWENRTPASCLQSTCATTITNSP